MVIVEHYIGGKFIYISYDTIEEAKAYNSPDKDKLIEELPPEIKKFKLRDKNGN